MDPVDVLTVAMHAAQLISSGTDPEEALVGAYKVLGVEWPGDEDDSLVLRIARLAEAAGPKRNKLIEFLNNQAGPLPLNRPEKGWGGAIEPAPAEDFSGQLREFSIADTRSFKVDDILSDSDVLRTETRGMAKRWLTRLLADAWNRSVATRELGKYQMAHGECYFFKKPAGSDSLSLGFMGLDGKPHRPVLDRP